MNQTQNQNQTNKISTIDLSSHIERDGISLNSAALFNVLLLALMFVLLSSKFIVATSFPVDLNGGISLPQMDVEKASGSLIDESLTILHLQGTNMIIFAGKIYSFEAFKKFMANQKFSNQKLLVKADRNANVQNLLNICQIAKNAGFERVQIAYIPPQ